MPANGLTYAGPHNCACYPEAKLDGMAVMASAPRYPMPANTPDDQRLVKGPAYADAIDEKEASSEDWPTYRSDNARSGAAKSDLKKDLGMAWEVKLTPPLSTTTTAAGLTFVSEVDKHTLHAFDAATGKPAWHFIAGGRIDSPPTYWKGRVFFGGKDGQVYCVRATDGALVWKFQAAPVMLSHGAWEMMESVWPVHGSVLVENGLVSCIAGHSCFLDGGLWFYRLDAKTGEMRVKQNYDDRDPDTGGDLNDRHKTLQMPVALNDILSSDGKWTYLRTQKIIEDGKRIEVGPVSGDADRMFELCRERFVSRHGGPIVGQNLGLGPAEVHHWLDGKEHAFLKPGAAAGATVVQHVRRCVEHTAQTVATEIAHNGHAIGFDIGLDRRTDIAKGIAGFRRCDPHHQRVMGHFDQTVCLTADLARDVHARGVAVPAVQDHCDVDVQDVAILELLITRDAVADDMVDRDAGRVPIPLVADGG
jgi:hypothetical protein